MIESILYTTVQKNIVNFYTEKKNHRTYLNLLIRAEQCIRYLLFYYYDLYINNHAILHLIAQFLNLNTVNTPQKYKSTVYSCL